MAYFEEAPEVKELAERIIDEYHPHLVDAKDLIGYYYRKGTPAVDWAGKAKKCTAFERHATGYLLFVFIDADAWQYYKDEQRVALVDHELCHFSRSFTVTIDPKTLKEEKSWDPADEPESWSIRDHDVEEFSDIVKRHGLWETGIERFAEAVRDAEYQMTISDVAAAAEHTLERITEGAGYVS